MHNRDDAHSLVVDQKTHGSFLVVPSPIRPVEPELERLRRALVQQATYPLKNGIQVIGMDIGEEVHADQCIRVVPLCFQEALA